VIYGYLELPEIEKHGHRRIRMQREYESQLLIFHSPTGEIGGKKVKQSVMRISPMKTYAAFLNSIFMKVMIRTSRTRYLVVHGQLVAYFRGYRQHALLNLVRMHFVREEYAAARKVDPTAKPRVQIKGSLTAFKRGYNCCSYQRRQGYTSTLY